MWDPNLTNRLTGPSEQITEIGVGKLDAAGLVVDDSIVVLENIQRLRGEGVEAKAAAVIGTQQVFFAVIATTITLICVFLPISFLPSVRRSKSRENWGWITARR